MKSVVTIPLSSVSFSEGSLSQLLSSSDFTPSTVGRMGYGNREEGGVRQSLDTSIRQPELSGKLDLLRELLPEAHRPLYPRAQDLLCPWAWRLVKYEPGHYFARHVDGREDDGDYATVLVFPPGQQFTGGDLVIYADPDSPYRFSAAGLKTWTLVAFAINVEHECEPITSGSRYVIKGKIRHQAPAELLAALSEPAPLEGEPAAPAPSGAISRKERKAAELEAKLALLRQQIAALQSAPSLPLNATGQSIVKQVKRRETPLYLVVLRRHYSSGQPGMLLEQDAVLYLELRRLGYQVRMLNLAGELNQGDGSEGRWSFNLSGLTDESGARLTVVYQRDPEEPGAEPIGQVISVDSEYNDETYDTISQLSVTALLVDTSS